MTAIFTDDEYEEQNLNEYEAFDRLPVVARIAGIAVRWPGPLVDLGLASWIGDRSAGAYGTIEECGWAEALHEAGELEDSRGRVRTKWALAFADAVRRLSQAGSYAGPEGSPEAWAAWLAFEWAPLHARIRAKAESKGWGR